MSDGFITASIRHRIIRNALAFAAVLLFAASARPSPVSDPTPAAGELILTILHDNDLHGHVFPFAYTEAGRSKDEVPEVGGAARRATLIRRLRAQIKNPLILVDAGDTFTRGPLTYAYEGMPDIESMNAIGYELAAIGNNEFKAKDGVDEVDAPGSEAALLRVIKRSRFPWVCANARDAKGAFLEGVQPYVVRTFNGVRVGFLGLTAPRSSTYLQTKGWTISDPIAAAKEWIPKARAESDVLIAVTHLGVDLDQQLAAQTTGLDAIVGGDSHTFLYKAVDVRNADGSATVPIVQDGEYGVNLGRFDLQLLRDKTSGKWRLLGYKYVLLPVEKKIPEAADVAEVLAPYRRPLDAVVGRIAKIAATPAERKRQTTQIVVDALRKETGADVALNPLGGELYEVFRHESVTRYDVFAIMPFHNNVVLATLSGSDIQAIQKAHADTVASGDIAKLEGGKTYKVALLDFMADSAYGIAMARVMPTGRDIRDVTIAYLKSAAP